MAFTPPAYNAVNVQFPGLAYTPPAYNAVNVSWVPGVPVVNFSTRTTLSLVGQAVVEAAFSSSSTSTCYFEHPYRNFNISAGSTANFVTWQRTIAFESGSSTLFRAGFKASIQNSTTLNINLVGAIQTVATIASSSATAFAQQNLVNRTIQVPGNTTTQFKGGRNYDTAILVHGKTEPNFRSSNLYGSSFTGETASSLSFRGEALVGSAFSGYGASSATFAARTGIESSTTIPTFSAASFYGIPAMPSAAALQGASNAAFVSTYDFVVINPIPVETDFVFAKTSTKSVYVLQ